MVPNDAKPTGEKAFLREAGKHFNGPFKKATPQEEISFLMAIIVLMLVKNNAYWCGHLLHNESVTHHTRMLPCFALNMA